MFQFSRKGISVLRAVTLWPRSLFAYGRRAQFDSRGGRWWLAGTTFSGSVVDLVLGGEALALGRRLTR